MTAGRFLNSTINATSFDDQIDAFRVADPFPHVVIDNFLEETFAEAVAREFPAFEASTWNEYNNSIEVKKACNHWDRFPPTTYQLFSFLNSTWFVDEVSKLTGIQLYPDPGLHGGGWHSHAAGGKLNTHLDYSLHPKTGLERRLNLILYLQPDWQAEWGGALGFWRHDEAKKAPGDLAKQIPCMFNRAVIFDTSLNSWHGLPDPVACPPGKPRNSIAVYYMCKPRRTAPERGRALFAPHGKQQNDPKVLELIRLRSQVESSAGCYLQKPMPEE